LIGWLLDTNVTAEIISAGLAACEPGRTLIYSATLFVRAPVGKKAFFFEKKKQKTFGILSATAAKTYSKSKSFLVLFFKKEHLPSPLPARHMRSQ
jgi:hypothetical protein